MGLRRFGVALGALCFVVMQFALASHDAAAQAPDHDASQCELCLGAPGSGAPLAPVEPVSPAVIFAEEPAPAPAVACEALEIASLPPARGPPSL